MKNDEEIVESLIADGIIGASLSELLSKNSGQGSMLGIIAGATIIATYKAYEKAKQTHVPFFLKENNALYVIKSDGSKHFVKPIEKTSQLLPNHFKLK